MKNRRKIEEKHIKTDNYQYHYYSVSTITQCRTAVTFIKVIIVMNCNKILNDNFYVHSFNTGFVDLCRLLFLIWFEENFRGKNDKNTNQRHISCN